MSQNYLSNMELGEVQIRGEILLKLAERLGNR